MDDDVRGQAAFQHEEEGAPTQAAQSPLPVDVANGDGENGMEALLRDNDYSFKSVRRGETIEGTIVRVDQDEVLVDIGLKSEGVIPSREFFSETEEQPELHVGQRTLVYVMQPEGADGHAILSLRRARLERSWREIEELYNQGALLNAPVVDFNKGGLIVDVKGVRGFVPVSQVLDLRNVSRQEGENEEVSQTLQAMNGRRLPLKIIEINRSRNRLILSERAAVQEQRTQRKDELIDQLEPGQTRRGVVSNLTSFGAFIDLGGADGLVHVSELSYNRVNHPSEVLRVGQQVDVSVLSVDRDSKKIALSLKKALPDPWTTVEEQYHVGQVVAATITKLAKFGAFAKVEDGLEGLIHLSELTDQPVQDASQVVHEGEAVNVKIIHINNQRRRLGLSVRQAQERNVEAVPPIAVETSYPDESPADAYERRQREEMRAELGRSDVYHPQEEFESPFAAAGLGSFQIETPATVDEVSQSPQSVIPATNSPAVEQTFPAADAEPQTSPQMDHEVAAEASAETSPVSEEPLPAGPEADQESEEARVASASPQGAATE